MTKDKRQFVKYNFYKVEPQWRRLPVEEREAGKEAFLAVVEEFASTLMIRSYSLVGLRGDVDFLLWMAGPYLETFQDLARELYRTGLGQYLATPYSYLAMTRPSPYLGGHRHPDQEGRALTIKPTEAKYLFVYPFVKTPQWYLLPQEERQRMMDQHFAIGHKYPSVRIHTTYSFGLDDQEFMLAFESDDPSDFLDLVMELREHEARRYTLRDTPIFTCVRRDLGEILDSLG